MARPRDHWHWPTGARDDEGGGYDSDWRLEGADAGTFTALLSEMEGRLVIRQAVEEASLEDSDPCALPTLAERLNEDQAFEIANLSGEVVGSANIDLLAPEDEISASETCPQRLRQAVGFEFLTSDGHDDEFRSLVAAGFTPAERAAVAELREGRKAGIVLLDAVDFPFSGPGSYWGQPEYRTIAEENLHRAVLELIAELRSDGML